MWTSLISALLTSLLFFTISSGYQGYWAIQLFDAVHIVVDGRSSD
ncbi:MAG: hypothetical protein AAF152_07275 [Cyanobacteria bacterium P01_A01_bin.114]